MSVRLHDARVEELWTSTLPAKRISNLRPSSLLCCRSDGLELSTGQSPRPGDQQQQLQATTEDGLLQPLLSTLTAVEMLYDSALYKCTIDIDIDMDKFEGRRLVTTPLSA